MEIFATRKEEQNRAVVDPWTAVHFSTGLAMGLVKTPFTIALAAAVAYELTEQVLERQEVGRAFFHTSGPETPLNAVADVVVFAAGHWLGTAWNRTARRGGLAGLLDRIGRS